MKYLIFMLELFLLGVMITDTHLLEPFWRGGQGFQRKLLTEDHQLTTNTKSPTVMEPSTEATPRDPNSSFWAYLTAAVISTVFISLVIALAIKCRFFQRYLASYHHSLLPEGDLASQYGPDELSYSGHDMGGREGRGSGTRRDFDDDDGFIEDNYIQTGERERVERARDDQEVEDSDDDLEFSIG